MSPPHLIREKIETGSLDQELGAMLRNPLYKDMTAADIINAYVEQREYEVCSLKWLKWGGICWLLIIGGAITLWTYLTYFGPTL